MPIDPNDIQAGDLVIIEDRRRNVLSGPTVITKDKSLALDAFGFKIPFAAYSDSVTTFAGRGSYVVVPGMRIVEHQAQMTSAEDYIAGRTALQRNGHFRTNPT